MNKLKNNVYIKVFIRYALLTITLFISAINFNLFMKPINFVTGGIPGLSIVMEHIFNIPPTYFMYAVYLMMFLLSFIILGKESIIGILYATIMYPTFVSLTSDVIKYIIVDYNDLFLICISSGVISGICGGIVYKLGFASSGFGVLGPIFNKCFNLPIASVNFGINATIVLIGGYFFGIDMVLYAIFFLYLGRFISNKIIIGISSNKAVFIRSDKLDKINDCLYKKYGIEAIVLNVLGGYTNKKGEMSLVVIPTMKYNLIINEIKDIDSKVFYDVLDGYEMQNNESIRLCVKE